MTASVPDLSAPTPSRAIPLWAWIALAILLAIGATIRIHHIDRESQWVDEFWSVYISTGRGDQVFTLPGGKLFDPPPSETLTAAPSWPHIWTGMDATVHPPLYHILLRWWMDLFGETDPSTRGFSTLLSLLGVIVLFDSVRRTNGPGAGLAAAAIMTLAVTQIDFSQETRSYTLLALTGLIACHALIRIQQDGPSRARLAELSLGIIAAALTHYFATGAIIALAIYSVIFLKGPAQKNPSSLSLSPPSSPSPSGPHGSSANTIAISSPSPPAGSSKNPNPPTTLSSAPSIFPPATSMAISISPSPSSPRSWSISSHSFSSAAAHNSCSGGSCSWAPSASSAPSTSSNTAASRIKRNTLSWPPPLSAHSWPRPSPCAAGKHGSSPQWSSPPSPTRPSPASRKALPPRPTGARLVRATDKLVGPHEPIVFYRGSYWYLPGFWYLAFTHYAPHSQRPVMLLYKPADADALKQLSAYPRVWLFGESSAADGPKWLPGFKSAGGQGISQAGWIEKWSPPPPRTPVINRLKSK